MKVGYSFWGFLGDRKFNKYFKEVSTPDGNAFYSWSIINGFVDNGYDVYNIMPNRDDSGYMLWQESLFDSWCKKERTKAYKSLICEKSVRGSFLKDKSSVFAYWDIHKLCDLDFIIHEWRMEIKGRNDDASRDKLGEDWQEDFFIQECLIEYCNINKIKLVVFDLDYKLTEEDVVKNNIKYVIELGDKWGKTNVVKSKKVFIPFDFNYIDEFELKNSFTNSLVYIGNRYERDWCIDKYIPETLNDCMIYGNWKEGGRDSEERWSNLHFGKRLQTSEMHDAYSNSAVTILLAKKEYCEEHFMTARIIEAIFYGAVPLFIEEYGKETIQDYAGKYADELTVCSKQDVELKASLFTKDVAYRNEVIKYMRMHLRFMDCKFFVKDVESLVEGE